MSDPPRRLCFRHCSRNRDSGRVEGSSVGDHADAGGQQEEGNRAGGREVQEVLRDETPAGGGEQSSAGVGPGSYKQLAGGCCPIAAHTLREGGYMDYTLEGHTAEAFNILNELRLAGHLCDVTLRVRKGDLEEDVKAHKVVLASCSPVFRAMFTAGLRESAMEVVPIEGIHPKVMQRLVEAAYTARLSVGERCVLAVLQAAAMYHMESVVRVCTHFLKEQLDPSNAIGIAALAESLGCNELHQAARHYIYRKFSEVCQHEEFLSLPHCQLVSLISRDELSVRCESEVFNACLTWARHDLPTRHPYMYAVLSAVRCHSLTPSFLQMQLQRCDELRRNSACTRFLGRVFRELTLHQPPAQAPRSRTPAVPQLLYAVGGYLRHSLPIMEAFDTRTSNWLTLPKLPSPMSGLAVSVVGGLLYAIGGRNNGLHGNEDSSALFCYNPVCNEWAELSHMGTARNRVAAAVVDGQIYAMGGSHGVLHHASVDRYDPELDTWTSVSPMSVARVGLGAAVLHRLIYAIGGFDGEQRLASAEVYHPENATWLPLASMSTVRSGAGVVALGEYVFALGGYDGERQLSSMERYDPRASRWEPLAPMLHTRSALAACTYNEHIYALGGYDGQTFLSSMERYDPVADRWEEVATMATGRSGAGLAVTMEPCLSRSETF